MKKTPTFDLTQEAAVAPFLAFVERLRKAGKRPVFELMKRKRTLSQNEMIYALYTQIAEQAGDQSIIDVRRENKLTRGVPILCAGNPDFKFLYDKAIKRNLTYEEKLKAMDILPVTSLMTKPQAIEYIETMIRDYSQQGYYLADPNQGES